MQMVRNRIDALVSMLAAGSTSPWLVMSTLYDLEKMWVHAVVNERVTDIVPIDAPWIGRPVCVRFPRVFDRVIGNRPFSIGVSENL